jgi:6-phosphofructokinase
VLIAIGGDDTLSYAARLHEEGAPTMCIPKTMDNDVFGTDYCIGFSTCVTRSVEMIHRLRTAAGSHERFLIVEMFGRNCGMTALAAGYLADADRTLIAEVPFELDRLGKLLTEDRNANPSNYAVVVVSEGAMVAGEHIIEKGEADAYGHKKLGGIGDLLAGELKRITGENMIIQPVRYLMRCGTPDSLDLMVGTTFGSMAFDLIEAGNTGVMVAVHEGKYTTAPLQKVVEGVKPFDVDRLYNRER